MSLPKNWNVNNLSELAAINYGKSPKEILSENGIYPVVGTGDVERNGNRFLYDGESIVLGRKGTIDRVIYISGKFWVIDTAYFLSNFKKTFPKWLYFYLQTIDLRQLNEATGVPSLSRTILYKQKVKTPPEIEQTRIAGILSTVDKAIEQTEALIAKQQRIKKGLMQDLLTKGIDENGNIRSEKTHKFKDSPLGRIPVEWEVDRLENLSKISSGITLGKSYSGSGTVELPYLRVANVQDGFLDLTEITTIVLPQNQVQRYKLEIGDVLMNEGGDFDKLGRGTVWKGQIPICLHQNHVFKVRCKFDKLLPNFLEIISQSEYGKKFFLLSSKQSTNLASINSSQLKSFRVPLPKTEEQKEILICFDKFNKIYINNQSFLSKLQSIKTGLMKDLLSGKRRVKGLLG